MSAFFRIFFMTCCAFFSSKIVHFITFFLILKVCGKVCVFSRNFSCSSWHIFPFDDCNYLVDQHNYFDFIMKSVLNGKVRQSWGEGSTAVMIRNVDSSLIDEWTKLQLLDP